MFLWVLLKFSLRETFLLDVNSIMICAVSVLCEGDSSEPIPSSWGKQSTDVAEHWARQQFSDKMCIFKCKPLIFRICPPVFIIVWLYYFFKRQLGIL